MTQFSHFFTAVRSLGQERDLRYRGAQKFRGPTGSTSTEPVNKDFEDNIALEQTNKQISTIFSCSELANQGKYVGCVTPLSFSQASQKKTCLIIKINCQITTLLTKNFCLFRVIFSESFGEFLFVGKPKYLPQLESECLEF